MIQALKRLADRRLVRYTGLALLGGLLFFSLPDRPIFRLLGVSQAQHYLQVVGYALSWTVRERLLQDDPSVTAQPARQEYGELLGMQADGRVVLEVIRGATVTTERYQLAGIYLDEQKRYSAAKELGAFHRATVRIDHYPVKRDPGKPAQVVLWLYDTPINLQLVESGIAEPSPQPETNIMARVFATYYRGLL